MKSFALIATLATCASAQDMMDSTMMDSAMDGNFNSTMDAMEDNWNSTMNSTMDGDHMHDGHMHKTRDARIELAHDLINLFCSDSFKAVSEMFVEGMDMPMDMNMDWDDMNPEDMKDMMGMDGMDEAQQATMEAAMMQAQQDAEQAQQDAILMSIFPSDMPQDQKEQQLKNMSEDDKRAILANLAMEAANGTDSTMGMDGKMDPNMGEDMMGDMTDMAMDGHSMRCERAMQMLHELESFQNADDEEREEKIRGWVDDVSLVLEDVFGGMMDGATATTTFASVLAAAVAVFSF